MSTKIKSIESKSFTNNSTGKTSVSHTVVLEDGVSGYLDDKSSDKDLKQGETVNYLIEVKQNKKGGNYNLLTIKRDGTATMPLSVPAPQVSTGGALIPQQPSQIAPPSLGVYLPSMTKEDWMCRAAIDAYGFMIGAIGNDKLDWPQVKERYETGRDLLWRDIDEVYKNK